MLALAQKRCTHSEALHDTTSPIHHASAIIEPEQAPAPLRKLPVQCHGCGALSQTTVPNEPGYYDMSRRAVRLYLGLVQEDAPRAKKDHDIVQASLRSLGKEQLAALGLSSHLEPEAEDGEEVEGSPPLDAKHDAAPLCDRCHNLIHHHTGESIYHPTIDAIRETIEESPYKYNHVYHILDAADFPMSLLPKVHQLLDLMPLRSKNRRQRGGRFYHGKKTELSFIITRSDLLAPKKEQVDRLMPYLIETLRQALPRDSRHVRLGNVRCVSSKRSWWTKELKEDIWKRGGAGWMVGRVNVGKSQLFHAVFPKGRMGEKSKHDISVALHPYEDAERDHAPGSILPDLENIDENSLLPPAPPETNYPQMPIVSALPGTTASPIRVPFGGGKGELIDLPGLARGNLEKYVREEHRPSLIMKQRVSPEQHVLKPGRSLLVGGFIRITPRTDDLIFLAYAFTPIEAHMTSTEKAIAIQTHSEEAPNVDNIALPETAGKIAHAGSFALRYDVTKRRAGPITRKDAAGIKVDRLPYRVLSIDILIEGCGWVEITAQVRVKDLYKPREAQEAAPPPPPPKSVNVDGVEVLHSLDLSEPVTYEDERNTRGRRAWQAREEREKREEEERNENANWPIVDIYSPDGQFIGSRQPMNAWLDNKVRKTAQTSKKRPRKSMTGAKKREKVAMRNE